MKCPKCGNEYEGASCPQCEGPKIIINNDEYMRRRLEWEENGKVSGTVFSETEKTPKLEEEALPDFSKVGVYLKAVKTVISKRGSARKNKGKRTGNKSEDNLIDDIDIDLEMKRTNMFSLKFLKKNWIKLAVCLAVVIVAFTVGKDVYKLAKRYSMTLYFVSDDGRICTGGLENKFVAAEDDVIFTIEGNAFFKSEIPSMISEFKLLSTYASPDGKYFVAETFDGVSTYGLYVWNSDGVKKVSEGKSAKEIRYISDKGRLVYTDISYLYENAIQSIALFYYDYSEATDSKTTEVTTEVSTVKTAISTTLESGSSNSTASVAAKATVQKDKKGLYLIDSDVRSSYIYVKEGTILYLNSANKLYSWNYVKMSEKILIAEDVRDIYGVDAESDNFYGNSSSSIKPASRKESFIYSQSGSFFYYDMENEESTLLFELSYTGAEIVYEKSQNIIYCITSAGISYGKVDGDNGAVLENIDSLRSINDTCYFASENALVYVNTSGDMYAIKKGEKILLRSGVASNSLNHVRNSDGLTYIADGAQYYRSSYSSNEVRLTDMAIGTDTSLTLLHRGAVYFMDNEGKLYSCSAKGTDLNTIGTVKTFWVN